MVPRITSSPPGPKRRTRPNKDTVPIAGLDPSGAMGTHATRFRRRQAPAAGKTGKHRATGRLSPREGRVIYGRQTSQRGLATRRQQAISKPQTIGRLSERPKIPCPILQVSSSPWTPSIDTRREPLHDFALQSRPARDQPQGPRERRGWWIRCWFAFPESKSRSRDLPGRRLRR